VSVEMEKEITSVEHRPALGTVSGERQPMGYQRLKPGPGQSPEQVRANQRARIHHAMVELAAAIGYEHVTVRALTRTARISSRTFYGHFLNREECMASAIDTVGRQILSRAARRKADRDDRAVRVRTSLHSLLSDLGGQPQVARVLLIESVAAGRPARLRAKELTADLERLVAHLLGVGPNADVRSHRLVIGIAAGVTRVATMTTITDRPGELPMLAGVLGDWVLDIGDWVLRPPSNSPPREPARMPHRHTYSLPVTQGSQGCSSDEERILSATARLAAEAGFRALSISKIRREAGVSRRTFDSLFRDKADCFLASIESVAATATARMGSWGTSTTAKGQEAPALCALAARNQCLARVVLTEILAPGPRGLLRREQLVSRAAEELRPHWEAQEAPSAVLPIEASVAAAWRIASSEIASGRGPHLAEAAKLVSSLISGPATEPIVC